MSAEQKKQLPAIVQWLGSAVSAFGFIAFFTLILSPAAGNRMEEWTMHVQTVPAHVQHCDLVRNGTLHLHEVRCSFAYEYRGKAYVATSAAWTGEGPFVTSSGLSRELARQTRMTERAAYVHTYSPERAGLIDRRWIAMPPLWLLLALLFVGCLAIYGSLLMDVHRRSDMVYQRDEATGRDVLVEAPGIITRFSVRRSVQIAALLSAGMICLYALMNRPSNIVQRAALTLQPTPARLVDCQHRWSGTTRGHDRILCNVQYTFNGATYTSSAESMDFHLFPTNARMDAEVSRIAQTPQRVAYVDPQHPTFAMAYVDNGWFAPYSLGIFELIVALFLVVVLPTLLIDRLQTPR